MQSQVRRWGTSLAVRIQERLLRSPLSPPLDRVAFPVDAIAQHLPPEMVDAILQSLADSLGDADGGAVLRVDEADHAILVPGGEGMDEGGPRALGGVAVPPPAPRQGPCELQARPALRLGESDESEEW